MLEILNCYGFAECGSIVFENGRLKFIIDKNIGPRVVYVWIEYSKQGALIFYLPLYVGLTETYLKKRCTSHRGGFGVEGDNLKGSTTGRSHRGKLLKVLRNNNNVLIYAQEGGTCTVFDREAPLCHAKEYAMREICREINPHLWNSRKF